MDRVCLPFCFSTAFESSQLVQLDNRCGLSCEELHSYPFGYGVGSGSTVGSALHMCQTVYGLAPYHSFIFPYQTYQTYSTSVRYVQKVPVRYHSSLPSIQSTPNSTYCYKRNEPWFKAPLPQLEKFIAFPGRVILDSCLESFRVSYYFTGDFIRSGLTRQFFFLLLRNTRHSVLLYGVRSSSYRVLLTTKVDRYACAMCTCIRVMTTYPSPGTWYTTTLRSTQSLPGYTNK